jgi:hypothetical protein
VSFVAGALLAVVLAIVCIGLLYAYGVSKAVDESVFSVLRAVVDQIKNRDFF